MAGDLPSNLALPFPTKILARGANTIGVLGLVYQLYQPPDLGRNQPCGTFTNHYHRGLDRGIDLGVVASVVVWATVVRVITA